MKNYLRGALMLLLPALMFLSCKDDDKSGANPLLVPVNPVAQPGNGQVILSWTAPEAEGIKGYTVTWTPNNGKVSVTDGSTSYTATGLTNEETYTFVIKTLYEQGASSGVTVKSVPKANAINYTPCTDFKATTGYESIQLSWVAPEAIDRATCVGYTISVSSTDKNEKIQYIKIDDAATTAYTLSNLKNGTTYTVKIIANYDNGGSSAEATVICTPSGPIKTATVEGAYVDIDGTNLNVYYTKPNDLKAVPITITLYEGASKAEESFTQTFDLSAGAQTVDFKFGTQAVTYKVTGEVDVLLTALKASYDNIDAQVTIDQDKHTILVDFGIDEVDKTLVDVELTLSKNAKPVYPDAVSDVTADFSKEDAKIEVSDKYSNKVSYAVTCKGETVVPGFDPSSITGKSVPTAWKRVKKYNDAYLPKSIAMYHITSLNETDVDAYVVSWAKKGTYVATHKVYSGGDTPISFADYKQMAGNVPVLISGATNTNCFAVHEGNILHVRPNEGQKSAFAVNRDGTWQMNTCRKLNANDYLSNVDKADAKWDAMELFGPGNFYLNPGVPNTGYTPAGTNDSETFFACYTPTGDISSVECVAMFVCKKSDAAASIPQDKICEALLSIGFNAGFDVVIGDGVGMAVNGKDVFGTTSNAYFSVAVVDDTK